MCVLDVDLCMWYVWGLVCVCVVCVCDVEKYIKCVCRYMCVVQSYLCGVYVVCVCVCVIVCVVECVVVCVVMRVDNYTQADNHTPNQTSTTIRVVWGIA